MLRRPENICRKSVSCLILSYLWIERLRRGLLDQTPKNPIVFCHGLLGFDQVSIGPAIAPLQFDHWRGIKDVLEAAGCEVLVTRVPATSSPVDRARVLAEAVEKKYAGRKIHLIGVCPALTAHALLALT